MARPRHYPDDEARRVARAIRNSDWMRRARRRARGLPEDAPRNAGSKGELHHAAKLTTRDIPLIRRMSRDGYTFRSIAEHFGVNSATISCVLTGKTWKEV